MKKFVIKISLAFVIIIVVLLILLGLRSVDGDGTAPSYSFLAGRSPVACREVKTGSVDKCYVYSFEGDFNDFNDVCLNAKAELILAGFVDRTLPRDKSSERDYWLKSNFPRGQVKINIYNNRKYIEHRISKEGVLDNIDGWIVVTIVYWRNWWWPF